MKPETKLIVGKFTFSFMFLVFFITFGWMTGYMFHKVNSDSNWLFLEIIMMVISCFMSLFCMTFSIFYFFVKIPKDSSNGK
jgi:hypothetical protein